MCGIVGYLGSGKATSFLINGLSKLEYRGYDSAGVAVVNNGNIEVRKFKGRLANLAENIKEHPVEGSMGIGHTRWATHGAPSDVNSHPHLNSKETIAVVQNGIIENYLPLRNWLKGEGYTFKSETDTEVIPNLIDYYYEGDLFKAVTKALKKLEGSYALGVVCKNEPDKLIAVRKECPLIVGLGKGESFIASDIPAVLSYTRDVYLLEDHEIAVLDKNGVKLYTTDGDEITKDIYHVTWSEDAAEKGGFEDFMLKEIHEQPKAIRDTMAGRISMEKSMILDDLKITKEDLENTDRVFIVACGTAYHAGLVGKNVIESLARIPVEVDIASEFRYRNPLVTDKSLVIVVSQSGETADTLAALRNCKTIGATIVALTNVVGSSVSREADHVLYTLAGPEISVASTKAYTTQIIGMYMIAMTFAKILGKLKSDRLDKLKEELLDLPGKVELVLEDKEKIKAIAEKMYKEDDMFYLGRGIDYAVALEGSLKLKEISYIHSEAYAGGELKHGPIALIEDGTEVITLLTQEALKEKMVSNVVEIKARGAKVTGICYEGTKGLEEVLDEIIYIPRTLDMFAPVLSVAVLQLFSYYVAKAKGCDIDKPRNLAKSVTVE
ncbi:MULTISPECIES: glutamine--fructose-6-phosphate transaminase (isomerizing) [Clostridium]|jgi:glucosamine--fructose-6-phosphate aminotransferase (isomerizing)|uniref:Glutamine--fructose-6-phosphate aminotransferase [isomerizing] n=3 Tax=root TaxID=1 RepID=C4IEW5_CLOBU|nr:MULTISPECIES: glutamine--fructose-6-phosphate transaminase (isomerizing) [Clostridium]ETI91662.1 MAG: Glutamine-fructose-6-phosphate transaminase Isomerizing [Clostridium butyricum DORA_1]ALP89136.1 glutamine--fructose-6-phosphate aminotransferase [Clostridium butyricum]ALS15600.1 glutamine--fructose-6-phosphate aminotransferase [Clostridium butyricum]ANF12750.1 glutamine--fructose-6-phosphate aminotransferase [Clostridium butyricum]AOR92819.1 glutamine--fructose-6-phosphate aminotransferas